MSVRPVKDSEPLGPSPHAFWKPHEFQHHAYGRLEEALNASGILLDLRP